MQLRAEAQHAILSKVACVGIHEQFLGNSYKIHIFKQRVEKTEVRKKKYLSSES
jgi:hypothetical protein